MHSYIIQEFLQARNVAEQLAAKLNTRLNYAPVDSEEPMEGTAEEGSETTPSTSDVIQKYEEELEINDFPQPVRWKITSRVSHSSYPFTIKCISKLLL